MLRRARGERRTGGGGSAEQLRVLILLQYYAPHRTGLTLHVQRLAEALVDRGHQVTVVTARHDRRTPRRTTENGVRVLRLWAPLRVSRGMVMPFHAVAVARALRDADLVSVHTPMLETGIVAVLARLRRTPLVITHHGDLVLPPAPTGRLIEAIVRWMHLFAMGSAARAIAYSDDYAGCSTFLAGHLDKTVAITPPVSIPAPRPERVAELRARLNPHGGPLIGYAGRFVREKRPDVALRSMDTVRARHPDATLAFAGEHQVPYEDTWRRLADLVECHRDHVHFLGLVDDPQELANFYAACDVLVLTSDTECFGLVQVESMLCGTPVVMTDIAGGRVPVQRTGMGALVPPDDPAAVGQAVLAVLDDPGAYARSRCHVVDALELDRTISRYEEVFRSAAAG
jgi:glycosyltransferase involved in cell wall biosynthesis